MYVRVIPRDLFNESKFLKCLGQLSLLIHNGVAQSLTCDHEDPEDGFRIELDGEYGGLRCSNLTFSLGTRMIELYCPYNSKGSFPLEFVDDFGGIGVVFNDDGSLSDEFKSFLDRLAIKPPVV